MEVAQGAVRDEWSCRSLAGVQPSCGRAPLPSPSEDAQPPQLLPGPSAGLGAAGGVSARTGHDEDQGPHLRMPLRIKIQLK